MKVLGIYFLLAFLTFSLLVVVDLLSGTSFAMSMHSFYVTFATTTLQETFIMVVFAALPIVAAIASYIKRNRAPQK
ncbi:hypothetical protein [Paenibacillus sp. sgz500992]|uniref:hypothetical protein n=1 Tax=Paenibacillus sp. sgz500992 TaxID=3242476 RepID=UPI0036D31F5B